LLLLVVPQQALPSQALALGVVGAVAFHAALDEPPGHPHLALLAFHAAWGFASR
jgi:hypothetical protein